jgi:hypothetical protein
MPSEWRSMDKLVVVSSGLLDGRPGCRRSAEVASYLIKTAGDLKIVQTALRHRPPRVNYAGVIAPEGESNAGE